MCRTVAVITVYWTGWFTRNRNLSTAAAASRNITVDPFLTDDVFIDTWRHIGEPKDTRFEGHIATTREYSLCGRRRAHLRGTLALRCATCPTERAGAEHLHQMPCRVVYVLATRRVHEIDARPDRFSAHVAHGGVGTAADVPADCFTVRRPDGVVAHEAIPISDSRHRPGHRGACGIRDRLRQYSPWSVDARLSTRVLQPSVYHSRLSLLGSAVHA